MISKLILTKHKFQSRNKDYKYSLHSSWFCCYSSNKGSSTLAAFDDAADDCVDSDR